MRSAFHIFNNRYNDLGGFLCNLMLEQILGALKETAIGVVAGLISSVLFLYLQQYFERRRSAEHRRNPPREVGTVSSVRPSSLAGILRSAKHVTLFVIGIVLVTVVSVFYMAGADILADRDFAVHGVTRDSHQVPITIFVFTIPAFLMSIRSQMADCFFLTWTRFLVMSALAFLAIYVAVAVLSGGGGKLGHPSLDAIFGPMPANGLFGWPPTRGAEGLFTGLYLLVELFLAQIANIRFRDLNK